MPEVPIPVPPPQIPQVQVGPVPPPALPPARLEFPVPQERRHLPVLPRVEPPAPQPHEANLRHQRMDALLAMEAPNLQMQSFNPLDAADPNRWAAEDNRDLSNRRSKKKHKAKLSDDDDEDASRIRRKGGPDEDVKRKLFHRRIQVARRSAARQRLFTRRAVSSSPSPPSTRSASLPSPSSTTQSTFDFTFRSPFEPNSPDAASPSSELPSPSPSLPSSLPISDLTASLPTLPSYNQLADSPPHESHIPDSPFPSVALQPPSGSIPFSLRPALPPPYPVRPPLPTLALPRSGSASPFLYSSGRTPLESPSHSTYRPPEELHTGPGAASSSYFNLDSGNDRGQTFEGEDTKRKKRSIDDSASIHSAEIDSVFEMGNTDVQAEHDRYFAAEDDAFGRDMGNDSPQPTPLDLMSDSDSELSEEEDGRGAGELADADDDDPQVALIRFEVDREGARAVIEVQPVPAEDVRVGVVPAEAPAEGQVPVNQPAAEEPPANVEVNDEADANVEDDMEGAMEG